MLLKVFHLVKALRLDRVLRHRVTFFTHSFTDYFKDFEKVEAVKRIFGEETVKVLSDLRVEFTLPGGYMGVNGLNGHLMVNPNYLKNGDKLGLYLDVIHELVHIRQCMEGKELFDSNYSYVQRPTEVEAHRYAVEEAKRLQLSDEWICEYLKTPWMSIKDLKQLAKMLNVKCE